MTLLLSLFSTYFQHICNGQWPAQYSMGTPMYNPTKWVIATGSVIHFVLISPIYLQRRLMEQNQTLQSYNKVPKSVTSLLLACFALLILFVAAVSATFMKR